MRRVLVASLVVCVVTTALLFAQGRAVNAQSYGPDVTGTATAYSCGDNAGAPASSAFDNTAAAWGATQITTSTAGQACIGQVFASGYDIRQITFQQSATAGNEIASAYWQYSDNGSVWHTVETLTLAQDGNVHTFSSLPVSGSHNYWRLMAASNPTSRWNVIEIEMMEAVGNPSATPVFTATAPSSTPTITLTPSTTPSPTPDLDVIITSTYGPSARLVRSADMGSLFLFLIQAAIFGFLIIWFVVWFWGRRNA